MWDWIADVANIVQKIKSNLIRNAQLKRSYDKLKSREPEVFRATASKENTSGKEEPAKPAASQELHPDRQAMLDSAGTQSVPLVSPDLEGQKRQRWNRQPRPVPFKKEAETALQRREERAAREEAFEAANREREAKKEERERYRKAMSKARNGGTNGVQRKLGRESKVLLEKVQRMVNE